MTSSLQWGAVPAVLVATGCVALGTGLGLGLALRAPAAGPSADATARALLAAGAAACCLGAGLWYASPAMPLEPTSPYSEAPLEEFPVQDGASMREIDLRIASRLTVTRTMEVVAVRSADWLIYHLKLAPTVPICCVAGKGNNGGNAITIGRMLLSRGYTNVSFLLSGPRGELKGIVGEQLDIALEFGASFVEGIPPNCVVVDGLLGTGISSRPRGRVRALIEGVNAARAAGVVHAVVSCDIPSGLNHASGQPNEPTVRADYTLCYHMPKSGLVQPQARERFVGELWACETDLTFFAFGPELAPQLHLMYSQSPAVRLS